MKVMEWSYIDVSGQQVLFQESQLGDLVKGGVIRAETLLWNETMSDWQQAGTLFPAWFSQSYSEPPLEESFEDIPAVPSSDPSPPAAAAPAAAAASTPAPVVSRASAPVPSGLAAPKIKTQSKAVASVTKLRETVKDFASYISANSIWMKIVGVLSIIGGALMCLTIGGILIGWLPIWLGVLLFKSASCAQTAEVTGYEEDLAESLYRVGLYFKIQGILMIVVILLHVAAVVFLFAFGGLALLHIPQGEAFPPEAIEEVTIEQPAPEPETDEPAPEPAMDEPAPEPAMGGMGAPANNN